MIKRAYTPEHSKPIEALMHRLGWRQVDIAKALGVNQQTISFWLCGRRMPSQTTLKWVEAVIAILDVIDEKQIAIFNVETEKIGTKFLSPKEVLEKNGLDGLIRLTFKE